MNASKVPVLSEIGKKVVPNAMIPVETLYKRPLDSFLDEFDDENIAELHFKHHKKRRVKNLVRLNAMIK